MARDLVRFDWAMKKLLRRKTNFDILEGFLTELLSQEIKIVQILESESNQETENDKHNRVDILVQDEKGDLVIIEVQNSKQYDYFHRILYGTSKVIAEYMSQGDPYADVRKVISITIAYFDLGQGEDYVYHGTNVFRGIHKDDVLALADQQIELYNRAVVHEIFPEYWVIKVDQFDDRVKDRLDEWIYFFKNSEIKKDFSAKGLKEASERLVEMYLNDQEAREYKRYLRYLHDVASDNYTKMIDEKIYLKKMAEERAEGIAVGKAEGIAVGKAEGIAVGKAEGIAVGKAEGIAVGKAEGIAEGKAEGIAEGKAEAIIGMHEIGLEPNKIAAALKVSMDYVTEVIESRA